MLVEWTGAAHDFAVHFERVLFAPAQVSKSNDPPTGPVALPAANPNPNPNPNPDQWLFQSR
eukprot:scaffold44340_cov65-Phaeocystis_antarctica.AAC.1